MSQEEKTDEELFQDYEGSPQENNAPVPRFLKITYWSMAVFAIIWWVLFWNGSGDGYFDRGTWTALQEAANTTWDTSDGHSISE